MTIPKENPPRLNEYIEVGTKSWLKSWRGDLWLYHLLQNGYSVQILFEKDFLKMRKRYEDQNNNITF